ncbi:hypothetical protein ACU686_21900 [Yinghuangia aomiensis]
MALTTAERVLGLPKGTLRTPIPEHTAHGAVTARGSRPGEAPAAFRRRPVPYAGSSHPLVRPRARPSRPRGPRPDCVTIRQSSPHAG